VCDEQNSQLPEPWTLALFVGGALIEALIALLGAPFALAIVMFIAGATTLVG
jgi:hypothetical protein